MTPLRRSCFFGLLFLCAALVLVPPARADAIYIYSGNNLTTTMGTCPFPCAITVILQYANPLPANASNPSGFPPPYLGPPYYASHDCTISPVCALISASGVTLSNIPEIGIFATGPDGLPTQWTIIGDNGSQYVFVTSPSGDFVSCGLSCNSIDTSAYAASNHDNPGSWSMYVTPVPEPSSLMLLGSGALGVIGMIRRKLLG